MTSKIADLISNFSQMKDIAHSKEITCINIHR